MKTNQTTTTNRKPIAEIKKSIKTFDTATAPQDTKQDTTNHLTELANRRNELLKALEHTDIVKEQFNQTVNELCETMAQIAVYKTLFKLSDSAKDISTSGAKMCEKLYKDFTTDMVTYRTNDTTANYSDAMDLFNLAYMDIWQYLNGSAPLDLDTTVHTKVLKNGTEKNYTLFQYACKSIRESIHSWSKSDGYKKLHYVIGVADNGEMVTSSKRPTDKLTDIDQTTKTAFFTKYGLTAQQQEIMYLVIKGEKADTIALLLNMPLRTVQDNIKKAKAKFTTASAYAEYITAKNAEKTAQAKAEKYSTDTVYQDIYRKAQDRTAKALTDWQKVFAKENRRK